MDIKEQLQCFLDHRREIVIRRTVYELKKAKEKAHILEGLKIAVENVDEIIELIKKAEGPGQVLAPRPNLIKNGRGARTSSGTSP